jgi:hypothetical protein
MNIRPDEEKDIMSDTLTYQQMGTAARGQAHVLFAQTLAAGSARNVNLTAAPRL